MTNESKTLFIPLYGKAAMSREGIFQDKTAEHIVESLPEDMKNVDTSRRLAIFMAMRAARYDACAAYAPPEDLGIPHLVVHLGCGLDSRCERVQHSAKCWYDLDFPAVIDLRKQYYQESERYRMIASSIMDFSWMDKIDYHGEYIHFLMEGVSMYLSESDMKSLLSEIQRKFGFCTFTFDAYTPLAAKCSKFKNPVNNVNAKIDFAMDDPKLLETDSIVFSGEIDMVNPDIQAKLTGFDRKRFELMGRFYKKFYRMFWYTINPDAETPPAP
ncbi:MAG: class I SAM-dependent methyltransferase [Oscillospiraceae bacterium]|nr:class I SAM-dependent methyltransferase [Oscillospiraceae bacterium]